MFDRLLDYFIAAVIWFWDAMSFKKSKNKTGYRGLLGKDLAAYYAPYVPSNTPNTKSHKVIVPVIRRVMPNVIAHDIINVQPMTNPIGQVHTFRIRYGNISISAKNIWYRGKQYFMKIYYKVRNQIQKIFYPYEHTISTINLTEQLDWLYENTNQYRWLFDLYNCSIRFRHKDDLIAFKLTWQE